MLIKPLTTTLTGAARLTGDRVYAGERIGRMVP